MTYVNLTFKFIRQNIVIDDIKGLSEVDKHGMDTGQRLYCQWFLSICAELRLTRGWWTCLGDSRIGSRQEAVQVVV